MRLGLLQEGQVVSRVQGERGLGTRGNTPDISTSVFQVEGTCDPMKNSLVYCVYFESLDNSIDRFWE